MPALRPDVGEAAAWAAIRAARDGACVPAGFTDHPICRALSPVARPGAIVVAQLGQSLDGRIATVTGASHFINGPAAIDHLHRLRALVDAVVVGVGTVIADDCRLTVRRVEGRAPARVVIDPDGRMSPDARLLAGDGARRVVIRAEGAPPSAAPGVETVSLPRAGGRIAPAGIVTALARLGLRRLLIEGGAETVSAFVAAEALDRLHLMIAPLIVGSGRQGLTLAPVADLEFARRPCVTAHPLAGGDVVFDCDMRREANAPDQLEEANDEPCHDDNDAGDRRLYAAS